MMEGDLHSETKSESLDLDSDSNMLEDGGPTWQDELQSYRLHIVERVQYRKISAALQVVGVIDYEDNEELNNHYAFTTTKMRLNHLVDIVLRKGEVNYKKFLEVLGYFYADVYTEITGNKPTVSPIQQILDKSIPNHDTSSSEDLVQLLMKALEGMQKNNFDYQKQLKQNKITIEERSQEIDRLKLKLEEFNNRVTRYENIDNEMVSLQKEVERLKNENYTICMRMWNVSEENAKLRMENMSLKNDVDKLRVDLQKMESCVAMERTQSCRLRSRLQYGPTDKDLLEMKREIGELKLKLAKANNPKVQNESTDMRIQILQQDKQEAIEMYEESLENLNKLREDLTNVELLRDKYLEEKEQLELTSSALRSDCDMYKMRRDAVWQQLQEVEKEIETLMKERNDAQVSAKTCMQEKSYYRAQIRELEERYDDIKHQLFERDQELIRMRSAERARALTSELTEANKCQSNGNQLPVRKGNSTISTTSNCSDFHPPSSIKDNCKKFAEFRQRSYITKHFEKYLSKSIPLQCVVGDFGDKLTNVFPEIELVANYGRQDSDLNVPKKERKRRFGNRHRTDTEHSQSETASTSASTDE